MRKYITDFGKLLTGSWRGVESLDRQTDRQTDRHL